MGYRIWVATLLFALGIAAFVEAREWVSRDGQFTVEAELLSVDGDQVVLRREGGAVIRVPLDRLSLADVKYVREAQQAVEGMAPTPKESPASEEPAEASTDTPATVDPGGPPLARPGSIDWQASADPPRSGFDLAPDANVEIRVPVRYSRPFVLFPSSPSPFVLLGGESRRGTRTLWDLRKSKAVAEIEEADAEFDENDQLALSGDGRFLAFFNHETRGAIHVWSFAENKVAHKLSLPQSSSRPTFLRFAGSRRLIVGASTEDTYLIYDVEQGRQCGMIEAKPSYDDKCQVVSPGGSYLAVFSQARSPLTIYDTRNGVRAGRLENRIETYGNPECLTFSNDGEELAASFHSGTELQIQVWRMSDGKSEATYTLPRNPINTVRYFGPALQWLADRKGWFLSGASLIDREMEKVVWQDQAAVQEREVLPRRIVDADRMLAFRKEKGAQVLHLASIPKEEIAQSRARVASGGTAADSGLPPVVAIKTEGAKAVALSPTSWQYRAEASSLPAKAAQRPSIPLGPGNFDSNRAFFSAPEIARVAIGRRVDGTWTTGFQLPQTCSLYDLQSGTPLAQFDVPFPTELIDLSPAGKLGLFRSERDKNRLDIWDLTTGKHVLAFRPCQGPGPYDKKIEWAGFLDEQQVLTASQSGILSLWKLPECQAVYQSVAKHGRVAGITRNRRTLVVVPGNTPYLVDTASGQTVGVLPAVESEKFLILPHASFSADENRLAILAGRDKGSLLVAWDLTDGSLLSKLELPFRTYGLTWSSPDHVLVNRSIGSDEPDVLIDVVAGLPVWNYGLERGSSLVSSPDGRAWFLPHSLSSSQLLPLTLPDERVTEILTRVPLPDPLIGPGSSVTIHAALDDPPEKIPPGWAHLEQLGKGLEQLFTKQLQEKHVVIAPRSPVRLIVGVEERKLEETMRVGRLFGPSQQVLVSATVLIPYVAVVDPDGKHVWSNLPTEDDLKPIDLGKCPVGMDKETYLELQQWDRASDWLHGVEIPSPLFSPDIYQGFGESRVTPSGMQIRRSPSPAQKKPKNKTAGITSKSLIAGA